MRATASSEMSSASTSSHARRQRQREAAVVAERVEQPAARVARPPRRGSRADRGTGRSSARGTDRPRSDTRPSRTSTVSGTSPCSTSTRCSSPSSSRTRGSLRARMPAGCSSSTSSSRHLRQQPIRPLRQRLHAPGSRRSDRRSATAADRLRRGPAGRRWRRCRATSRKAIACAEPRRARCPIVGGSAAGVSIRSAISRAIAVAARSRAAGRAADAPRTTSPGAGVDLGDVGLDRSRGGRSASRSFAALA